MFIAHIPAGYLATRALLRRLSVPAHARRRLMMVGVAASVLPDADLLWWHFVDHRRQVHHAYLTHIPLACLVAFAIAALVLRLARARRQAWIAGAIVAVNVMLHLLLDTVAGGIRWAWPMSGHEFALSAPTARYGFWIGNFVMHWTFALEVLITAAALWVWWRARREASPRARP
ncbi:MAG TPA: metal-dependent hydrolase [Longimicrobium sp.]|jgi:inner membrane protein|uniref:metal-dependent hydrolase n=1 Tax=Longimicrobium sp. TaxID=2029185 RepID=UPI002ED9B701